MDDQVLMALIVAIPAFFASAISPLLLSYLTNRHRRQEKMEDYARQDAVAAKAAEAAQLLLERQDAIAARTADAARLLAINTAKVAEATKATNTKLDVIHGLVNSNMTAAMQSEADATVRELAMMLEVVELKKAAGHEPSSETRVAIETTRKKIAELMASLTDRRSTSQP